MTHLDAETDPAAGRAPDDVERLADLLPGFLAHLHQLESSHTSSAAPALEVS